MNFIDSGISYNEGGPSRLRKKAGLNEIHNSDYFEIQSVASPNCFTGTSVLVTWRPVLLALAAGGHPFPLTHEAPTELASRFFIRTKL
jgi:hypothetical protein